APDLGSMVNFSKIGNGGASEVLADSVTFPNLATIDGTLIVNTGRVVVLEALEISDDLTVEAGGTFDNQFATTIGENLTINNAPVPTDTSFVRFFDEASVGGDLS